MQRKVAVIVLASGMRIQIGLNRCLYFLALFVIAVDTGFCFHLFSHL